MEQHHAMDMSLLARLWTSPVDVGLSANPRHMEEGHCTRHVKD